MEHMERLSFPLRRHTKITGEVRQMRNLAMAVSYNGAAYSGYQTQPNGNTVQDKLEEAVWMLTGEKVKIYGSGRTDAGVHARGQIINFQTDSAIPVERWSLALNSRLPKDIVVYQAAEVPVGFHARRSALRKTYRYSIQRTKFPDVFNRETRFHHPTPLRVEDMRSALAHFVGEHDFTSFCSNRTPAGSHVRTIFETRLELEPSVNLPDAAEEDGDAGVMHIYVTGNGFLYNMVRIIVGTLIEVGEGKRPASAIPELLKAKDRAVAGPTAVPYGLTLWSVEYGFPLFGRRT